MSAKRIAIPHHGAGRQHGAALMVMLVILIVGAAAILVNTLNSSTLQIARDNTTADVLAQARDALIGYAVSDANRPGELPCPDFNNDGMITISSDYSGSNCATLIGWLPWKTLGLPDLRDGNGDRLWYAVSNSFRANGTAILNSDTPTNYPTQMLTINDGTSGAMLQSKVVAIIFSPGTVLTGKTRSVNDNSATGVITNYLEGSNANPSSTVFQTANSTTINDRLLAISSNDLLTPVETRIAHEVKNCLDDYAADSTNTYHRYPWAASDSDNSYTGSYDTLFGRVATTPITTTKPIDSVASTMLTALSNLQTTLNAYSTGVNAATTSALLSAAQTLITAAQNAENYPSSFSSYVSITDNADRAGDRGRDLANGVGGIYVSTVQYYINKTNYYLASNGFIDSTMPMIWPSTCMFYSSYWGSWQNEIFYQVASGNRPGSPVSVCNTSCLTINGSGNTASGNGTYRAAIIVGRSHNGSGSVYSNPPSYYLEGSNLHDSTGTTSTISKIFETYRTSDTSYSTVNDLVLCLDGKNNCI